MPSSSPWVRLAAPQSVERAPGDGERGKADQDDLDQRGQRLGLAVAEAMLVVGRHGRPAEAEEGDQAGDQIERGVGEAAKHRNGSGCPGCVGLEPDEEQSHRNAGDRRAAGQLGTFACGMAAVVPVVAVVVVMMGAGHG